MISIGWPDDETAAANRQKLRVNDLDHLRLDLISIFIPDVSRSAPI